MILTKEIKIRTKNNNSISYYRDIGLDISSDFITVDVSLIKKNSNCLIEAKCEVCNKVVSVEYRKYNASISKGGIFSCSRLCAIKKRKNTWGQF